MKKYKIVLTEAELKELAVYTGVMSDIKVGKVEEIANKGFSFFVYNLDFDKLSNYFKEIKKIQFPNLKEREYLTNLSKNNIILGYISQLLKNAYAYGKYPQGGVTNWFTKAKKINEKVHFVITKK